MVYFFNEESEVFCLHQYFQRIGFLSINIFFLISGGFEICIFQISSQFKRDWCLVKRRRLFGFLDKQEAKTSNNYAKRM